MNSRYRYLNHGEKQSVWGSKLVIREVSNAQRKIFQMMNFIGAGLINKHLITCFRPIGFAYPAPKIKLGGGLSKKGGLSRVAPLCEVG